MCQTGTYILSCDVILKEDLFDREDFFNAQNARKIMTFELLSEPPKDRGAYNPWPQWPRVFRIEYGHEEVNIIRDLCLS